MAGQRARRTRRSPRVGVSALGVLGALLVHGLLLLPFVLDLSLPSRKASDRSGLGASRLFSVAEPEMTVVFVSELAPVSTSAPPKLEALASRGLESLDVPVVLLSSDDSAAQAVAEVAADRQQISEAFTSDPDPAQHALLYGRYLGQVQARVERAWLRPRTEIGAPRFSCQARVKQDRRGAVVDVRVDHCNGTQRWQQSLVSAIRTASPLPAPPDASVYADILWLSFVSEGFQQGGSPQGFEPEASQTALYASEIARQSFEQGMTRARRVFKPDDKEDSKVIHLTIIGSPAPGASPPNEPAPDLLPPPTSQSPPAAAPPQ
jgi:hypothetical protein